MIRTIIRVPVFMKIPHDIRLLGFGVRGCLSVADLGVYDDFKVW